MVKSILDTTCQPNRSKYITNLLPQSLTFTTLLLLSSWSICTNLCASTLSQQQKENNSNGTLPEESVVEYLIESITISDIAEFSCPEPKNVMATVTGLNSISLSWDIDSHVAEPDYLLEFGPEGFVLGSRPQATYRSTTLTINDLSHSNTYDFYIKTDCGAGNFSLPVKVTATTLYPAFSIPFSENFNSVGYKNIPYRWSLYDLNRDYKSSFTFKRFGASEAVWNYSKNGTTALYVGGSCHSPTPMNDWLITPRLNLVPGQEYQIEFLYNGVSSTDELSSADLEVFLGSSDGISSMQFSLGEVSISGKQDSKTFRAIFKAPTFDSFHIGFQAKKKSSGLVGIVVIDDVSVIKTTSTYTASGIITKVLSY